MLNKLFKKSKNIPNPGIKKLSVALVNKVGLTDEAFEILFNPFIENLVLAKKEKEIINSTEELLGDTKSSIGFVSPACVIKVGVCDSVLEND